MHARLARIRSQVHQSLRACKPFIRSLILTRMAFNHVLPEDLDDRLAGLGEVIAGVAAEIDFAYLFGSVARGLATSRSDVDVAVHASGSADYSALRLTLIHHVAKHLGTDAVDVVVLNTAPTSLAGRVLTS